MPITRSAKKALRQSEKKRIFNIRRKKEMRGRLKEIKKLLEENKKEAALKLVPTAYKALDKAAKRGVIKKNTASRKKSRLMRAILKI
ncbi:30S ribosomal protein S20 [Patescibacteria group bacterium]|nr:30S ribosomal protein S20 [Patescibacteria group bacterium]